ncbi:MAG TPA: nucleoside recognition domain-containing protein [Methanothrix sp.]|nr:nucleoside recognition domain-containing protein [Methanothrix sp.]HPJ83984.1 nucleoside recognition domain-containing protein [Methanothrix sp.]HPR65694.1 nucleoside recognition domain-containing protein [Methanothrix sp.]
MPLIEYLIRTTILMAAGVIVANIAMESNLLASLARPIGLLTRASKLPESCTASIFACMISPAAGKSALSEFYRRGEVGKTETLLTILISTFPVVLGESLFRVQAPIAVVLLGPVVGGTYVILNLFSSFIQSFSALLYSRLRRWPQSSDGTMGFASATTIENIDAAEASDEGSEGRKSFRLDRDTAMTGLSKSVPALRKSIPMVVATMILMDLLMSHGAIDGLAAAFAPFLRALGLPGECVAPLAMQFVHFSAGYASVAALMEAGAITSKQAIITLIVGSMGVITMIYVKYSISMYLALFGRFGAKIALVSYLFSMAAKVVTIFLALMLL